MKLFDRAKLAVLGGALAIGTLGGLTAGTSSAMPRPFNPCPQRGRRRQVPSR